MIELELKLSQAIERVVIEEAATTNGKIPVKGIIEDEVVKGEISFTGTSKVNDRGWSGYFTKDNGEEYYASSNQWHGNECKVIDLIDY